LFFTLFTYLCNPFKEPSMGNRHKYEIAFVGLKPGIHEFLYEIDDKFFAVYGPQEFSKLHANVKLMLDKHTSFLMLKFEVGGNVQVSCDRCGNPLTKELWDEFDMLVKMVDNPDEMNDQEENPDVFYISRTESHLDVSGWIYEFVSLSIPLQHMCSEDEMGGPQCNKEVLDRLRKMEEEANLNKENDNPIWKGLDKFRNN
jgi:uncharacterized metal-binding protein YceD (DUF177 family)